MTNLKSEISDGLKLFVPLFAVTSPFGLLFGAVAVERGLSGAEALMMSATMFAGASQFVALDQWQVPPAWLAIVVAVFAVNFRHVLYGASIGRKMGAFGRLQKTLAFFFLVDPQWAAVEVRAEEKPQGLRPAYYFALALPLYVAWVFSTWLGTVFGNLIENPEAFGIDLVLPVYFLGLTMGFRKRANWLPVVMASALASVLVYLTLGSPWHISLGAAAGILVAAIRGKPKPAFGRDADGD